MKLLLRKIIFVILSFIVITAVAGAYLLFHNKYVLMEAKSTVDEVLFSMMDSDMFLQNGETAPFYNEDGHIANGLIAHAAGAIDDLTYTNSKEAFLKSISLNYRFIELDLLETSDGHIIVAHDWNSFAEATGVPVEILSNMPCSEILKLKIKGKYTILDGDEVCRLMKEHPHFILVTDKITNYELLMKTFPFPNRLIVETFHPWQYWKALNCGIKYPAYCLRKYECLLDMALTCRIPIVTVDGELMRSSVARDKMRLLHKNKTCIMVYCNMPNSVDNLDYARINLGNTCSMIYTNFLTAE